MAAPSGSTDPNDPRALAVERLSERRSFGSHVAAYLSTGCVLVLIWALTGRSYFWPIWVLGFWGIGLVMHAWEVYGRWPITEGDIREEMERITEHAPPAR